MSHFDQAANSWDTPEKVATNKGYAQKVRGLLDSEGPQSILDLGCGTGLLGLAIAGPQDSLLGVDLSQGMIDVFNQKVADDELKEGILLNLEESELDRKFDLIVSAMAFHHLREPAAMACKLAKMLSKNGSLMVIDLDQEDGSFHPDPKKMGVHHFGFSKTDIESWIKGSALTLSHHEIVDFKNKNERSYPIFLAHLKI